MEKLNYIRQSLLMMVILLWKGIQLYYDNNSTTDLETPPLEVLETRNGDPNINNLINALKSRQTGRITYPNISRPILRGEDQDGIIYEEGTTSNYFYSVIENTDFSFAYNFENDDLTFIYPSGENLTSSTTSVYHDLTGYSDVFPSIYSDLMVQQPGISADYPFSLLTFRNSTIKLAPKAFCNPNRFLRDYDYPNLTLIHNFLNGAGENVGCDLDGVFEIRARPETYITSGMEAHWGMRDQINNTHLISLSYIATNAGVIRAFPGVRWPRRYDPTTRPYYHRAVASRGRLAVSYAYRDAAGAGKVVTLSEVLYLGKRLDNSSECAHSGNRSERCECTMMSQCVTGRCERGRCVGTQVEGVVGIDMRYNDFHDQIINCLSPGNNPCGRDCDTEPCPTRCYIIDESGNVIFSEGLRQASELDTRNYNRVPLGRVEPGVMRELVRTKSFFIPEPVQVDFQGTCERLNYFVPGSNEGIIRTAEEEDNYLEQRGPLRRFQNEFGCVQDIIRYQINSAAFPAATSLTISGTQESACSSGTYYLTDIPETNTYLLVVDDWTSLVMETRRGTEIGLNCLIAQTLYAGGAHRAVNGTCNVLDDPSAAQPTCPAVDATVQPVCRRTGQRGGGNVPRHFQWYIMAAIALCLITATI